MYASGRVKRYALREWNAQQSSIECDVDQQIILDGISLFQKQVYHAANKVHPGWVMEYWDDKLQYPVDMALPSKRIVIEADGPTHFTCNTRKPLGATDLKRRLLKKLGWNLIVVPYYEWNTHATQEEQLAYMSAKIGIHSISQQTLLKRESSPSTRSVHEDLCVPLEVCEKEEEDDDKEQEEQEQENRKQQQQQGLEQVQKNASVLDILQARQGKMSLNQAMKRQIVRRNKQQ
jgi:hypothetical protein